MNDCRDGLSGDMGTQLTGVNTVAGVEVLGSGQFIKKLSYIGDKGVILLCGLVVSIMQFVGHLIIVPALGRQLAPAFLIGPGGIENRNGSALPDLLAELLHTGKEAHGGSYGPVAHLLEHHVIPVFIPQHRLGLSPQFGARVQMLRQPCPASGMANHFCAGQPSQHLRHMIGEGKAVAQHENTHHGDPFL